MEGARGAEAAPGYGEKKTWTLKGAPPSDPQWHWAQFIGQSKPFSSSYSCLGAPFMQVPGQCLETPKADSNQV